MRARFFPLVVLAIAAWIALSGIARADDVKVVAVAPNLYVFEGLEGGRVAFLVTGAGVVVVDSGTSPVDGQRIVQEIARVTPKPIRYLVLTHYHGDHTYGMQSFPEGIGIIAHHNLAAALRRFNEPRLKEAVETRYPALIAQQKALVEKLRKKRSKTLTQEEQKLKNLEETLVEMKNIKVVNPDLTYDGKLTISLGGETVEVVYLGSAHSSGDSLVYFPAQKVVHAGDLCFNGVVPYIDSQDGCDTANWIEIMKEAGGWTIEKVIPGHGALTDREGLARQAAYLVDLRAAVADALRRGETLEAMKKGISLPAWKSLVRQEGLPQNIEAVYNEMKREVH